VAIGVAGLTAGIVIGAGVFIAERVMPSRLAASDGIAPVPPIVAPPSIAPLGRARASGAAPSAMSAAPSASTDAAPSATAPVASTAAAGSSAGAARALASAPAASAAAGAADLSPASLPPEWGYLTVRGQGEARVYVNGVDIGPINQANKTRCGVRYVRIGTAESRPSWFGPGQSVVIGCRAVTELKAPPPP
jgi:hypothetical protein